MTGKDFTLQENVPLAPLTTLRVGGPARFFVRVTTETALTAALAWAEAQAQPVFILGGGSNVVIADAGWPGLVLQIALKGICFAVINEAQTTANAGAGEVWDDFVAACVARDLAGVECLSGIPGLVGGTPVQNVGAYGQEVAETIVRVRVYDRQARAVRTLSRAECAFGYRSSLFNTIERERYIVLAVDFNLQRNGVAALRYADLQRHFAQRVTPPTLAEVRAAVLRIRAAKSMVLAPDDPNARSAGSFFKNPIVSRADLAHITARANAGGILAGSEAVPHFAASADEVKIPAAWLIERAGFAKGYRRGPVGLSTRHTLALVTAEGAQTADLLELMREIQNTVAAVWSVTLQPEPVFIGLAPGEKQ